MKDNNAKKLSKKDIELNQTIKIFKILAKAIKNGSISYRDLIYDELGFYGYYDKLLDGMVITNSIVELEEKTKNIDNAIDYIDQVIMYDLSNFDYKKTCDELDKLITILAINERKILYDKNKM